MIRLHDLENPQESIWINPDHIFFFKKRNGGGSFLMCPIGTLSLMEEPSEIERSISAYNARRYTHVD